ncbi:MAG: hypothetical protein PHX57_04860, partial [Desulfobulbaceae bacterium]|nr:hypothetical protein [Desulfobulbaceae bacterium]
IIRDADDCVCAFQYEDDARRFESELAPRLAKFGLEVAREKTRTLRFSRFGGQENGTFCFLGYEYRWVERRSGKPGVQRRTAPRKKQASIANFTEWIKRNRHKPLRKIMTTLCSKLQGYWNYYGVRGNMESLLEVYREFKKLLYKWRNRRSQKRSCNWQGFLDMLKHYTIPSAYRRDRPIASAATVLRRSAQSEWLRRALCGKTVRRDLSGGPG